MNRILGIAVTCLALAGGFADLASAQGRLSWDEFFTEYCGLGSNTCMPTAKNGYRLGKSVQETVDDISALRAGALPVEKLSMLAAVSAYQEFLDRASKLAPAELDRGQTEFKGKPEALLAKFAAIRGECGAAVSAHDRRTCYEQAMAAIIPARKG